MTGVHERSHLHDPELAGGGGASDGSHVGSRRRCKVASIIVGSPFRTVGVVESVSHRNAAVSLNPLSASRTEIPTKLLTVVGPPRLSEVPGGTHVPSPEGSAPAGPRLARLREPRRAVRRA